jgi:hypothetical protein
MSQIKLTFILFRMIRTMYAKLDVQTGMRIKSVLPSLQLRRKNCQYESCKCLQGLNRRVNGRLKNVSLCGELWCSQCKQWCHEECCTVTAASVTCLFDIELKNNLKHVFYN